MRYFTFHNVNFPRAFGVGAKLDNQTCARAAVQQDDVHKVERAQASARDGGFRFAPRAEHSLDGRPEGRQLKWFTDELQRTK